MPALRVKAAGVMQAPLVDGKLRVKIGGVWRSPSGMRVKADGAWRNPGYTGAPDPPTGLAVAGWNFSVVHTAWNAPAGGPAIDHYEAAIRYSDGNGIPGQPDRAVYGTITYNWNVTEDGLYRFWVRSVGVNGLVSAWVGPLNVGIGHTEQGYYASEARYRSWYQQISGNWYKDAYAGGNGGTVVYVPNSVRITAFHYGVYANAGFTSVLSPYGNRYVTHVFAGNEWGDQMNLPSPFSGIEYGFNNWGGDSWWGIMAKGAGWTVSPGGTQRMVGDLGVEGEETYYVSVYYMTRAYASNFYW